MKSWEAGRIELGREFARICELIDKNISEGTTYFQKINFKQK